MSAGACVAVMVRARRRGMVVTAVASAIAFAAGLAVAQCPDSAGAPIAPPVATADPARVAQPERPSVATHAYTVARGYAEVEAGAQLARVRGGSEFDGPVVLKFGLAPRVQLELADQYLRVRGPSTRFAGFGDASAALKWRLLDRNGLLGDFAVQPAIAFPTGRAGTTGTGTSATSLVVISSRKLGQVELDVNAGVTVHSGDGSRVPRTATLWTASFGGPVTARVGWVAELFGYPGTGGAGGTPPQVGMTLAATLTVHPWLVLDAGLVPNVEHLPANALFAGVTWNAGRI